jgi:hypothetical protein
MSSLSEAEKRELCALIQGGNPLPEDWRVRLFPGASHAHEMGKDYRLDYAGKMKREEVLAETPAAPWQLVRSFCSKRTHEDGWRNLLVWGDNLLPVVRFRPQEKKTTEYATYSKRGRLAMELEHRDWLEIEQAVKLMRLFFRDKDAALAKAWPKKRLHQFIVDGLLKTGQDPTFLGSRGYPFAVCVDDNEGQRIPVQAVRKRTLQQHYSWET